MHFKVGIRNLNPNASLKHGQAQSCSLMFVGKFCDVRKQSAQRLIPFYSSGETGDVFLGFLSCSQSPSSDRRKTICGRVDFTGYPWLYYPPDPVDRRCTRTSLPNGASTVLPG